MAEKATVFMQYTRMEVKVPKCPHMHGCRSGNNWYTKEVAVNDPLSDL